MNAAAKTSSFEFEGRPLRDWLVELVALDPEVRRAAGDAMMAMYYEVPSVHTDVEHFPNTEGHTNAWRRAVREAVEQPAFPRRAFFMAASARLIGAHDDYMRDITAGDPQFDRICDQIGDRLKAATSDQERAQQARRLGLSLIHI